MLKIISKNNFYRKIYDTSLTQPDDNRELLNFIKNNSTFENYSFENLKKEFNMCNIDKIFYSNYIDGLSGMLDKIKMVDLKSFETLKFKLEKFIDKILLKVISCNKNIEELKKLEPLCLFGLIKNLDNSYSAFELSIRFKNVPYYYYWELKFEIELKFAEINSNL